MTPEAQRIAIAEACGWKLDYNDPYSFTYSPNGEIAWTCLARGYWPLHCLPNYTADLNAMHEAEKVLTDEQIPLYIATLLPLTGTEAQDLWYCATATAAQRAEAFLKTIRKWEDGK